MSANDEENQIQPEASGGEEAKPDSSDQSGMADTVSMGSSSPESETSGEPTVAAKPKKKADDDWVTAAVPQPPAAPAPPKAAAAPATPPPDAEFKQVETPPPAAEPYTPPAPAAPASGSGPSGIGGILANIGIKDKQTQQWVLIGGGILLALCCLCLCGAIVIVAISGS
jgi:hypothetical protein